MFKRFYEEVQESPLLRRYGFFLALVDIFSVLHFLGVDLEKNTHGVRHFVGYLTQPIFWVGAPFGGWVATVPSWAWATYFTAYGLAAVFAGVSFLTGRRIKAAYFTLLGLFLLKSALLYSNSPVVPNFFYIELIVDALYLFVPRRRDLIPVFIILFYVAAGFLKVNTDWLSGGALLRPFPAWVPRDLSRVLLLIAPIYEIVVIWGFLGRAKWTRFLAYAFTISFHLISIQQVQLYYPLVMLSLTAIFPMAWYQGQNFGDWWKHLTKLHWALIGAFIFAQIYPRVLPGDQALTGQARFLALNMLDATPNCPAEILLHFKGNKTTEVHDNPNLLPVRTRCLPIRFFNTGLSLCKQHEKDPDFLNLDIAVVAKRRTDAFAPLLFSIQNFCTERPGFNYLLPNPWLNPQP